MCRLETHGKICTHTPQGQQNLTFSAKQSNACQSDMEKPARKRATLRSLADFKAILVHKAALFTPYWHPMVCVCLCVRRLKQVSRHSRRGTKSAAPFYLGRSAESLENVSDFSMDYHQTCRAAPVSLVIRCPLRRSAGKFARPFVHCLLWTCREAPPRLDNQPRCELRGTVKSIHAYGSVM